jgi:Dyp-type peroxidase family
MTGSDWKDDDRQDERAAGAIDLDRPLPLRPTAAERAMLRALQGNVLAGHGRRATAHVFLRFDPRGAAAVRAFLRDLGATLTSAHAQQVQADRHRAARATGALHASPVFRACLLSFTGYEKLRVPDAATPDEVAFRAGMKSRALALRDPDPRDWEAPYRDDVDALVLLAGDPRAGDPGKSTQVDRALAELRASLPAAVEIAAIERGRAYFNANGDGIEHFGYVDGRSQLLLRQRDVLREAATSDGKVRWDPAFPMRQVLVRDPAVAEPVAFGSYFVYRKLEQDVRGFAAAERALAEKLCALDARLDPALAGASLVGRFEDGTPVLLQHGAGMHHPVANDFDYAGDPQGLKCPFHAHIRKVNPRGDTVRLFGASLAEERSHLVARRGIPYGARRQDEAGAFADFGDEPVGLLFMACQAHLGRQFEFVQRNWANGDAFAEPDTGVDPVIGQGGGVAQRHRAGWGDASAPVVTERFEGFVALRGGEYFFAPSLPFFAQLGDGPR